ncbi:Ribonuclease 3-like protein 1 [Sesamum angolense]|uniref:Ribonuclease 3-like protein 1 n=1 Tax=Sesamum angolense TaxID=2727404 RepID=A0AAE1WLN8_9LAMI|nr:Ribonuclease 3-like protein 1 [Sesamum angolense]
MRKELKARFPGNTTQLLLALALKCCKEGSPKAHLHELCAREHWKQPVFECCKEEGPDHSKLFTFKVLVETEEEPTAVLECFGNPRPNKKAAAEDAAEGALWCLKHMGYQLKKQ